VNLVGDKAFAEDLPETAAVRPWLKRPHRSRMWSWTWSGAGRWNPQGPGGGCGLLDEAEVAEGGV